MTSLEKHRVHHSYVWLGSIRVVAIILFATAVSMGSSLIGVVADGTMGSPGDARLVFIIFGICALVMLAVVVAVVVYQVVSYKHVWYEIGPTEFDFYQGILSKKRVHIPYQRIQSVDQRASLFQRLFGVCTVSIDTAGGSNNKATVIPYLTKQDAETLRRELFARKRYAIAVDAGEVSGAEGARAAAGFGASTAGNVLDMPADLWDDIGGVFAGQSVDTGVVSFEYGLTNKELILTGLSNNTAFALVLIGVLSMIGQLFGMALDVAPGATNAIGHAVATGSAWAVGAVTAAGAALVMGVVVLIWLLSAVATCVSYGGFKARRRGNRIEVEHGLLQHRFRGVDIDRVQSVTVRQSFIRRLLKCCEISVGKVEAVAESDGSQQTSLSNGLVIHPFVRIDRVPEILAGIIPEYADVPYEAITLPRVALRRGIIRRCVLRGFGFWFAVLVALGHVAFNMWLAPMDSELAAAASYVNAAAIAGYVFAVVLLAIDVVGAVLWYRESSFAFNRGFMQVTTGGLARETTSFPRGKIQFGHTRENPFQRRAGTKTVLVRTAAGVGGSTVQLVDVASSDASAWLDWLKPRGNALQ